jgi:hypothetical protein
MGALVLLALAPQELGMLVGDVRARAAAPRHLERERREVGALDVVVQVGGREREVAVGGLHGFGVSSRCRGARRDPCLEASPPAIARATSAGSHANTERLAAEAPESLGRKRPEALI